MEMRKKEKFVYFDTTFLHYGEDLRGIPQVILQLVRLILECNDLGGIMFITTRRSYDRFLHPLGVPINRVERIPMIPFITDIRLHGVACNLRYWKVKRKASFIIHPEYRTVLKTAVRQLVLYYDFIFLDDFSTVKSSFPLKIIGKKLYRRYIQYKLSISCGAYYKISISNYSKQQLLRLFPSLVPSSVEVLYLGSRISHTKNIASKNPPSDDILNFLCVGGIDDPRKNIFNLIKNIIDIAGGRHFYLHLVGKCSSPYRKILSSLIDSLSLDKSVLFHGVVPDILLNDLYDQIDFLLFPSLAEGFGLPVIEAMAHGDIVCAFNNSSIPEIGGDAIIIAGNNDFVQWGKQISSLMHDPAAYRLLSRKAIERAALFSEDRMFERYKTYFMTTVTKN